MFVPADVDLADLAAGRRVWWLMPGAVNTWGRMMAAEKIRNYKEAVTRLENLRKKYDLGRIRGFLRYLRFQETGSVSVAEKDVSQLMRRFAVPARLAPTKRVVRVIPVFRAPVDALRELRKDFWARYRVRVRFFPYKRLAGR